MSDEPPRPDEPKATQSETERDADGVDGWIPTWVLGLVPLVVAGIMLVLALHV